MYNSGDRSFEWTQAFVQSLIRSGAADKFQFECRESYLIFRRYKYCITDGTLCLLTCFFNVACEANNTISCSYTCLNINDHIIFKAKDFVATKI